MFEWISDAVTTGGYFGIAFLMFAENVFPPIPSELIMPLAGFSAAKGDLHPAAVLAAGTFGSLLGALPWYVLGRLFRKDRLKRLADRHGRWLTMTADDVEAADRWFDRNGARAVLWGRLVPTVRTLISVPAGLARMNLAGFLAWSALGTFLWNAVLVGAGYVLESQYEAVAAFLDPVTKVVVGLILAIYAYRVATYDRRLRSRTSEHRIEPSDGR